MAGEGVDPGALPFEGTLTADREDPGMHGLVFFQVTRGLLVRRREEVVRLRNEACGRLEGLDDHGTVLHRPGPLEALAGPPFVEAEGQLLNQAWQGAAPLPGGWPAPSGPQDLPPPATPPPPDEVLYLQSREGQAWWVTDRGRLPAGTSARQAARSHPHLVQAGRGTYVNARRLRAVLNERKRFRLVLEGGSELTVSWGAREALARGLGLPRLDELAGTQQSHRALMREGLRDWPLLLTSAPAGFLKEEFGSAPRRLVANLLWETVRLGLRDRGREHRGFWYRTLLPCLVRAGLARQGVNLATEGSDLLGPFLAGEALGLLEKLTREASERLYDLLEVLAATLVGRDRLFTYRDLGFRDPRPDLRHLGERSPEVVVVAEKATLQEGVEALAATFGVSTLTLGGLPSLLSTEFLASELLARGINRVLLVAFVDFDPGGWIAARGLADQLLRYGIRTRGLRHLVRPERFTPEEIELYGLPIPTPTPQIEGKVKAWLRRSGGVQGRPLALHADHLRPVERVLEAFRQEVRPRKGAVTSLEAPTMGSLLTPDEVARRLG